MEDPERIAWMKPSGHGPSTSHMVATEQAGVVTTFCGRTKDRADLEEIDENEAEGECALCVRGHRRALLADEKVDLDLLERHGAITESAAELLAEVGLLHTRGSGSGKYGRILKSDAQQAVSALED